MQAVKSGDVRIQESGEIDKRSKAVKNEAVTFK